MRTLASISVWASATCAWLCLAMSGHQLLAHGYLGATLQSAAVRVDVAINATVARL